MIRPEPSLDPRASGHRGGCYGFRSSGALLRVNRCVIRVFVLRFRLISSAGPDLPRGGLLHPPTPLFPTCFTDTLWFPIEVSQLNSCSSGAGWVILHLPIQACKGVGLTVLFPLQTFTPLVELAPSLQQADRCTGRQRSAKQRL
jgi:hypothetical protein